MLTKSRHVCRAQNAASLTPRISLTVFPRAGTERCRLHAQGDLSAFYSGLQGAGKGKKGKGKTSATTPGRRRQNTTRGRSAQAGGPGGERTTKQLLGELYADKAYLEVRPHASTPGFFVSWTCGSLCSEKCTPSPR
jgi:hypothetical protein